MKVIKHKNLNEIFKTSDLVSLYSTLSVAIVLQKEIAIRVNNLFPFTPHLLLKNIFYWNEIKMSS